MIHAVCDFCGKDCDCNAIFITMRPFSNFARYHCTDQSPYGKEGNTRSFVMCNDCRVKHNMPNPYETYSGITSQLMHYEKCLDNYTDEDLMNDTEDKR